MSAVGFLNAPLAFDFARSWPGRIDSLDWQQATALLSEMETEGQALLEAAGVPAEHIRHRRIADLRYIGQGHEIESLSRAIRLTAGAFLPLRPPLKRSTVVSMSGLARPCRLK